MTPAELKQAADQALSHGPAQAAAIAYRKEQEAQAIKQRIAAVRHTQIVAKAGQIPPTGPQGESWQELFSGRSVVTARTAVEAAMQKHPDLKTQLSALDAKLKSIQSDIELCLKTEAPKC